MTVKTDIQKIQEAKRAYKALIQSIGTSSLKELCEDAMAKTGATAIRWRQYTPYFNDGDPCEFGVGETTFRFDDTAEDEGDYGDGFDSHYRFFGEWDRALLAKLREENAPWNDPRRDDAIIFTNKGNEVKYKAMTQFDRDIRELEEVLLECFDDHKMITYEDGAFTVEDYDHD